MEFLFRPMETTDPIRGMNRPHVIVAPKKQPNEKNKTKENDENKPKSEKKDGGLDK